MLKTAVYCFIYLLESLIKRKTPPFGPLDYDQLSMQNLKVVFELTDNSKLDRGAGVLDQYLGKGQPLKLPNPETVQKKNNLNLITLSKSKDKIHAVFAIKIERIHVMVVAFVYLDPGTWTGVQTNFMKQVNSVIQLIPCLQLGQLARNNTPCFKTHQGEIK